MTSGDRYRRSRVNLQQLHIQKRGHSSPPCPHMAGTRSPVPILYLDESIGFLVPSFLRPDGSGPSSLRSGPSSLRSGLSSPTYRFITALCKYRITLNISAMEFLNSLIHHTQKNLSLKGRAKAAVCVSNL